MRGRELVGNDIKRVRVAKGFSQEQLAFDAAIDRSYLGGIERCDVNPSVDTLDKIAGVLGIELAELFQPIALDAPIAFLRGRSRALDADASSTANGPESAPEPAKPRFKHGVTTLAPKQKTLDPGAVGRGFHGAFVTLVQARP